MAMAASSSSLRSLNHTFFPIYPSLSHNFRLRLPLQLSTVHFRSSIRATSAVAVEPDTSTQQNYSLEVQPLACPVCYEPLIRKGPPGFNLPAIYRSGFKCKKCDKSYSSKDNFLDLTVTAGTKDYTEVRPAGTELFRNLSLVRADVSRLSFASGSVDAVHAGASLHCWPSPSNAVAEISRILRSGGVFVGTTFLRYTPSTPWIVRPFREGDLVGVGDKVAHHSNSLAKPGLLPISENLEVSFSLNLFRNGFSVGKATEFSDERHQRHCSLFVNLMEGHIWIESDGLGKGCTAIFIVKLGIPEQSNDTKLPFITKVPANHAHTHFPGLKVLALDENG